MKTIREAMNLKTLARFGHLRLEEDAIYWRKQKLPRAGAEATLEESRHGVAGRRSTFTVTVRTAGGTVTESAEGAGSRASISRAAAQQFANAVNSRS